MATLPDWQTFTQEIGFDTLNLEGQALAQREWLQAQEQFIDTESQRLPLGGPDTVSPDNQATIAREVLYSTANQRNRLDTANFARSLLGEGSTTEDLQGLINEAAQRSTEGDLKAVPEAELDNAGKVAQRMQLFPNYGSRFIQTETVDADTGAAYSVFLENSPSGEFVRVALPDNRVVRSPIEDKLTTENRLREELNTAQRELFDLQVDQEAAIDLGTPSEEIQSNILDKEKEIANLRDILESPQGARAEAVAAETQRILQSNADAFPSQSIAARVATDFVDRNTRAFLGVLRGVNLALDSEGVEQFAQNVEEILELNANKDLKNRLAGGLGEFGRQLASEGFILAADIITLGGAAKAVLTRAGANQALAQKGISGLLGAKNGFAVASDEYREALEKTGDKEKAAAAYLGSFVLNTGLEAVSFDRLFDLAGNTRSIRQVVDDLPSVKDLIEKEVKASFVKAGAKGAIKAASPEVLTEVFQEVGTNGWAVALYDENREIFNEAEIGRSAAIAAILGGTSGFISGAIGQDKLRKAVARVTAQRDSTQTAAQVAEVENVSEQVKEDQRRNVVRVSTRPVTERATAVESPQQLTEQPQAVEQPTQEIVDTETGEITQPVQQPVQHPVQQPIQEAPQPTTQPAVAPEVKPAAEAQPVAKEAATVAPRAETAPATLASIQASTAPDAGVITERISETQSRGLSEEQTQQLDTDFNQQFQASDNPAKQEVDGLVQESQQLTEQAQQAPQPRRTELLQEAQTKLDQAQNIVNREADRFIEQQIEDRGQVTRRGPEGEEAVVRGERKPLEDRVSGVRRAEFKKIEEENLTAPAASQRREDLTGELRRIERGIEGNPTQNDIEQFVAENPEFLQERSVSTPQGDATVKSIEGDQATVELANGQQETIPVSDITLPENVLQDVTQEITSQAEADLQELETQNNLSPIARPKPAAKPAPQEVTERITSTARTRREAAQQPIQFTTGAARKSEAFQRTREVTLTRLKNELKTDEDVNIVYQRIFGESNRDPEFKRLKMSEDIALGVSFVAADPKKALKIAQGLQNPPEGISLNSITRAVFEKETRDGNYALANAVIRRHTMRLTRAGQEIAAQKGWYQADEAAMLVNGLTTTRMHRALEIDYDQNARTKKDPKSVRGKYANKVEKEANQAVSESEKQVNNQMEQDIDKIIDSLVC